MKNHITTKDVTLHDLGPHSDLTYRRVVDLQVCEADLEQSLLTGSFIRRSTWHKVRFQRSDLDGVRAEQSTFTECDFSTCDIRSSRFIECNFHGCVFNESFIDDCEFLHCLLDACTFRGSSLTRSRFQTSHIRSCTISPGTFLHNRLYDCTVADMLLGDATISYIILRRCKLLRVTANAESLGAMFGLTRTQMQGLKLVYLGKQQIVPTGVDIVELAADEYRKRRWYLGELVLALNCNLLSVVGAFRKYFFEAGPRFAEMGFAKGDEIQFIGDILDELAALQRLPLLTVMDSLEWCRALGSGFPAQPDVRENDALRGLAGRTSLLAGALLDKLDSGVARLENPDNDFPIVLAATFNKRPEIAIHDLLNSMRQTCPLAVRRKAQLIREETGSYKELVSTTLFSVLALQAFLFLLNGCLIQITELKQRVKVLMRKGAPKEYRELSLVPTQRTPPIVLRTLSELAGYAKGLPWLSKPSLGGFASENVEKLQISPSRTRRKR